MLGALVGLSMVIGCAGESAAAGGTIVGKVSVYSPEQVEEFVAADGSLAYLEFPGARPWALACDGGPYVAMPVDEVVAALRAMAYPTDLVEIAVLVLAWPRRDVPKSSAEGTVIFLSPGRVDYPTEHVHYTVAHEMGHVIHHALMPDYRGDLWGEYARLRAIDPAVAGCASDHASRIHEIFAEDFRVLFGGALSQCGSGVENHDLVSPDQVAGLREFFLSLPEVWREKVRISVEPNPFNDRLAVRLFSLADEAGIDGVTIYDVQGRLVVALGPSLPSRREVIWDGLNSRGGEAAAGAYFAAVSAASETRIVKVLRMPR